jgi:hypothetical protein
MLGGGLLQQQAEFDVQRGVVVGFGQTEADQIQRLAQPLRCVDLFPTLLALHSFA